MRQKSRWMLGINLQAWASLGWTRDWWTDYALARDRKALVSQLAILVGYVVLAVILFIWGLQHLYRGATDILLSSSRAPGSGTWFS